MRSSLPDAWIWRSQQTPRRHPPRSVGAEPAPFLAPFYRHGLRGPDSPESTENGFPLSPFYVPHWICPRLDVIPLIRSSMLMIHRTFVLTPLGRRSTFRVRPLIQKMET